MYPPRDPDSRRHAAARARRGVFGAGADGRCAGGESRRERQLRSGLTQPPRLTPAADGAGGALPGLGGRHGADGDAANAADRRLCRADQGPAVEQARGLSAAHLAGLGLSALAARGVGRAAGGQGRAARRRRGALEAEGVDAIWVSNHAGRQFDAAPATIEALPAIRAATTLPVILDGGIEGGLDILRAVALGADFVMMGRAGITRWGAGTRGPAHLADILREDLRANMGQLGLHRDRRCAWPPDRPGHPERVFMR